MDLTGVDENVFQMLIWWICLLFIFGTFASFTLTAGLVAGGLYILITWIWLD